jgi:hypothetical protein
MVYPLPGHVWGKRALKTKATPENQKCLGNIWGWLLGFLQDLKSILWALGSYWGILKWTKTNDILLFAFKNSLWLLCGNGLRKAEIGNKQSGVILLNSEMQKACLSFPSAIWRVLDSRLEHLARCGNPCLWSQLFQWQRLEGTRFEVNLDRKKVGGVG